MKQEKNNYVVYKAVNNINGFTYVGVTTNSIHQRKLDHIEKANRGESGKFYDAISTYGINEFTWEKIDTASSIDELAEKEKQYILEYKSKEKGYNSDSGGGLKKSIYQYTFIDGSLVNKYDCLQNAANSVNTTKQHISRTCLGINQSYAGFYWSYEYNDTFKPKIDKRLKNVYQLSVDGKLLNTFKSVADANRATGVNKSGISKVCRQERKHSGGYIWKYA